MWLLEMVVSYDNKYDAVSGVGRCSLGEGTFEGIMCWERVTVREELN